MKSKKLLSERHAQASLINQPAFAVLALFVLALAFPEIASAWAPSGACVANTFGSGAAGAGGAAFENVYCNIYNLITGYVGGAVGTGLLGYGAYQAGFGRGGIVSAVPPFFTGLILALGPTMAGWLGYILI
jgi:hypothetical protein